MDYNRPDTYVEFKDSPVRVIEGVNASTLALAGLAKTGPVAGVDGAEAQLITGWNQFAALFGGAYGGFLMPELAFQFFAQGGGRLYVSRIAPADAAKAFFAIKDTAGTPVSVITVSAKYPGLYGNALNITIAAGVAADKLITITDGVTTELIDSGDTVTEAIAAINAKSKLCTAALIAAGTGIIANTAVTAFASGADGTPPTTVAPYLGVADTRKGLHAFDTVRELMAVACPDASKNLVAADLKTLTDSAGDLALALFTEMFFADAPMMTNQLAAATYFDGLTQNKCVAKMYPWVEMNGISGKVLMPASGIGAMETAIVTGKKGVHVAPAGTDFPVKNVSALLYNVSDDDQEMLHPKGINCIRAFPSYGVLVWGSRSASNEVKWRQISVVRLFQALALGLKDGLKWVVFKPNVSDTWDSVVATVTDFLMKYYRDGAFAGSTVESAFFAKCDETLNTPEKQLEGKLTTQVGAAPSVPGEYIIIELGQWTEGQSVSIS